MSSARRPGASEDSILASLERGPAATRTHRNWLIAGGSAAGVLTLMIAWLAYGNATSVRTLPPSAVRHVAAPPPDNGIAAPVPSLSIPAPQAAAIVDEPAAEPDQRPALVMLPPEQHGAVRPAPEVRQPVAAPVPVARPAVTRPAAAAPRQVAKSTKTPASRAPVHAAAAKKPKAAPPGAGNAASEIDSDVALLSAIVAHSTRHAAERARLESCQGKKCPPNPSTQP